LQTHTYESYYCKNYIITFYRLTQLIEMVYKIHDEEVAQGLVDKYRRLERPEKMEGVHLHEL